MAEVNAKESQKEVLENLYNPPVPLTLIYRILVFGTMGVFFATLTVRVVSPNKLPQLIFQQQTNSEGQNNDRQ